MKEHLCLSHAQAYCRRTSGTLYIVSVNNRLCVTEEPERMDVVEKYIDGDLKFETKDHRFAH